MDAMLTHMLSKLAGRCVRFTVLAWYASESWNRISGCSQHIQSQDPEGTVPLGIRGVSALVITAAILSFQALSLCRSIKALISAMIRDFSFLLEIHEHHFKGRLLS